jgi:hypothetical protein
MFRSGVPPHIGQSPVPGSEACTIVDELIDTIPAISRAVETDRERRG